MQRPKLDLRDRPARLRDLQALRAQLVRVRQLPVRREHVFPAAALILLVAAVVVAAVSTRKQSQESQATAIAVVPAAATTTAMAPAADRQRPGQCPLSL